jgi:Flp pilus assembly protein TadG
MINRCKQQKRAGVSVVETAVILPVAIFFILAVIVGSMGIFRYNELASLARDGARYAATHGARYERETGNPAATPEDVYNNAILPKAALLKPSNLSYSVTWDTDNYPVHVVDDPSNPITNMVSVKLTYQWDLEVPLLGPITMSSTSTMPMSH